MASFENVRWGSWSEVARESRVGRYLPLYLAGIAAGTGAAIGLALTLGGDAETVAHVAPISPVPVAAEAPAFIPSETPGAPLSEGAALNQAVELPAGFWSTAPVATSPEPAPAVPVAQAQAAPVAPAAALPQAAPAQPVPAPAPAPAPAAAEPQGKPNFYVPAAAGGGITDLEQRLLSGINAEREKAGLAPYAYDTGLSRVARTRSQQMVDQGYFGHIDPYGYAMYTELLAHFGYTSYAWAGENLALNNYNVGESPERAIISLMKSPTHAANILAGDFYRIGIGEVTTADGKHYYSMIFLG